MEQFILPFLTAFLVATITTPLVIRLAFRYGFVDNPSRKHPAILHRQVVARAGGIPLLLAIGLCVLLFFPPTKQLVGILAASILLVITGLLDDKYDLSPFVRLAVNIVAAILVVASGVGISYITNPLSFIGQQDSAPIFRLDSWKITIDFFGQQTILVWSAVFAVIWMVWVMNMLNWSAGVDGQMPGIVIIAALVLTVVAWRFAQAGDQEQLLVAKLAMVVAGASGGFLLFNWHPAQIFPGYGATILGLLLSVLAIFSAGKVATAVLVMGVPTMDAIFTIMRRVLGGRSPFRGDRGHLHHLLLELGWGHKQIALFYWAICAMLGAAALMLDSRGKLFAILVVAIIVGGSILWLTRFTLSPKQSDQDNG